MNSNDESLEAVTHTHTHTHTDNFNCRKIDLKSKDIIRDNLDYIADRFPNVIKEGKIDFNALKQELSNDLLDNTKERFCLTWSGKKDSIIKANKQSINTLRPIKGKSLDFNNTHNIYIEGDNLEVLKILQESYLRKIKCIYIDPPYNTGSDLIYNDNYATSKDEEMYNEGIIDSLDNKLISNISSNGRFHSDWLSMMYPRLKLARNLLTDDGVIFISIDDNEQANLKVICDEIFGEKNFIGVFCINSTPNARDYGHIGKMHEYALFYAKNIDLTYTNMIEDENKKFTYNDKNGGFNIHPLYNSNEAFTNENRPNLYYPFYVNPQKIDENGFYEIGLEQKDGWIEVYPPKSVKNNVQFVWRWGKEEKARANLNKEIVAHKIDDEYRIVQKMRNSAKLIRSFLYESGYTSRRGTAEVENILGEKIFSFPKPIDLIELFLKSGSNKDSYILDFFSGSATTAHAVMQLNAKDNGKRKFIMVQIPEKCNERYSTICELAEKRIKNAGEIIKKATKADIDYGFRVFKVDSSNMKDIYYEPSKLYQTQINMFESNIKEDRTAEDLLTQVILDLGLTLDLKVEEKEILNNNVYFVADNSLIACFDNQINIDILNQICEKKPLKVVFRESSFKNDSEKINAFERVKKLSPETEINVI